MENALEALDKVRKTGKW